MNSITKSRNAMMLLTGAAGFYALGTVMAIIAYATLSGGSLGGYTTFRDLGHAAGWLHFVGAFLALSAVGAAGWENMSATVTDQQAELGVAAVATLLMAVGSLVGAASDTSTSTSGVLLAVGVGIWGLLAFSRAARLNLAEQQNRSAGNALAPLWLCAAAGLVLFAIGSGFDVGLTDQGLGIAVGILEALGFSLVAWAIASARTRGHMTGLPARFVVQGLALLAVAGVAIAVVAGLVFTPNGTLKGLRIGVSIAYTVRLVGVLLLGWAAWRRLGELVSGRPAVAGTSPGWSWPAPSPAGQAPTAGGEYPPEPVGGAPAQSGWGFAPQATAGPPPPPAQDTPPA